MYLVERWKGIWTIREGGTLTLQEAWRLARRYARWRE